MKVKTNQIKIVDKNIIEKLFNDINKRHNNIKIIKVSVGNKKEFINDKGKFDWGKLHTCIKKELNHSFYEIVFENDNITFYSITNKNIKGSVEIDLNNIVPSIKKSLIEICFKILIFEDILEKVFKEEYFDIKSNLFFNIKSSKEYYEGLLLKFEYSIEYETLIFKLHKNKYKMNNVSKSNKQIIKFQNKSLFDNEIISSPEDLMKKIDARNVKINFMEYNLKKFEKSKVYFYSLLFNTITDYLNSLNVEYEKVSFEANYKKDIYLKGLNDFKRPVLIINNMEEDFNYIQHNIIDVCMNILKVSNYTKYNDLNCINEEDLKIITNMKDYNLLFLSNKGIEIKTDINTLKTKKEISKIKKETKCTNIEDIKYEDFKLTFEQVNHIVSNEYVDKVDIDNYSLFKIEHLLSKNNALAFQNIIIKNMDEFYNLIKDGDKDDYKIFFDRDIKDIHMNNLKIRGLNQNKQEVNKDLKVSPKMEKTIIELKLKEHLFIKNSFDLTNSDLKDKCFSTIYTHSKKFFYANKNHKYEVVIKIDWEIKDKFLYLKSFKKLSANDISQYKFIKTRTNDISKIIDNQFFILDEENQIVVSSFTNNSYIPSIIGNMEIDTIKVYEEFKDTEAKSISKTGIKEKVILPYYTSFKEYSKNIQIVEEKEIFKYIIPFDTPSKLTIEKENKIYYGLVKNYDGNFIEEYNNLDIYNIFLSTFSNDIIRINENSVSNILYKFSKLLIEN